MQLILSCYILLHSNIFFGQNIPLNKINTTSAEIYFTLADTLRSGKEPTLAEWQSLFDGVIYRRMIDAKVLDTAIFKIEMRHIYSTSIFIDIQVSLSEKDQYHKSCKENEKKLKKYICSLKSLHVEDSVKALLYTMLPKRFQAERFFPFLFYLNNETDDAPGPMGIVINDLLLSYKIDQYKFGLLAAHQGFHAIVSAAFMQKLETSINDNAVDYNLFFFLENISEEGIADLIDKPLLSRKNSPVYAEIAKLTQKDETLAPMYIRKIDSLLKQLSAPDNVLHDLINFSGNGGRVPGRFMGNAIKKAGLLQNHLTAVEDPISFIETYNAAAKKLGKRYPLFSKESIGYLQQLKAKYWKD